MNARTILVAALLGAAIGFAAARRFPNRRAGELQARLERRPPVVVVDFARLAAAYPPGASREELDERMAGTRDAIAKLRRAGYLVLDAASVVAAPKDLYLPAETPR